MTPASGPDLPAARPVTAGRGRTGLVRDIPGPPGAPTLVLLHGWLATADLNWWGVYGRLSQSFRVIAPDLRGHGGGPRGSFSLAACADDVATQLEEGLGVERALVAGYSMGGPVSMLLWHRHHRLVSGLVLCATSLDFPSALETRLFFNSLTVAAAITPPPLRRRAVRAMLMRGGRDQGRRAWVAAQVDGHDHGALLSAGRALGRHDASSWAPRIDVPTAVVLTTRDGLVPPSRQRRLAATIPGAETFEVDGDHIVCATRPRVFGDVLDAACRSVARRAQFPQVAAG